jgi:hypothetical protein
MRPLSASVESACIHFNVGALMRPLSAKIESACLHFNTGALMRPLSANVESACPHFDVEPITTCRTDYSHAMYARRGSKDELFEESSSRCPPQSMLW